MSQSYFLEALQPCDNAWQRIRPPDWWSGDSESEAWEADSPAEVVQKFIEAYPNRHPAAKPYREFRVTPADAVRRFRIAVTTFRVGAR